MAEEKEKEKKIGYYLLGKTIGEGTFGKVKLATHSQEKKLQSRSWSKKK